MFLLTSSAVSWFSEQITSVSPRFPVRSRPVSWLRKQSSSLRLGNSWMPFRLAICISRTLMERTAWRSASDSFPSPSVSIFSETYLRKFASGKQGSPITMFPQSSREQFSTKSA